AEHEVARKLVIAVVVLLGQVRYGIAQLFPRIFRLALSELQHGNGVVSVPHVARFRRLDIAGGACLLRILRLPRCRGERTKGECPRGRPAPYFHLRSPGEDACGEPTGLAVRNTLPTKQ